MSNFDLMSRAAQTRHAGHMRFAGRVFETPVFRKVVTPSILLKKPPKLATTEVKAILEGGGGGTERQIC